MLWKKLSVGVLVCPASTQGRLDPDRSSSEQSLGKTHKNTFSFLPRTCACELVVVNPFGRSPLEIKKFYYSSSLRLNSCSGLH